MNRNEKHIPILFSTPMVQAILDGRKTMTRRVAKQPKGFIGNWLAQTFEYVRNRIKCPYGKPGDILWVRETFAPYVISDYDGSGNDKYTWLYKADGAESQDILEAMEDCRWKPGIHMPKSACRIFLEVVSVRVERLQEITEQGAIAEGVEPEKYSSNIFKNYDGFKDYYYQLCDGTPYQPHRKAKDSFESLWRKINGPDSWEANPWVWVIEFKRVDKPTDFLNS